MTNKCAKSNGENIYPTNFACLYAGKAGKQAKKQTVRQTGFACTHTHTLASIGGSCSNAACVTIPHTGRKSGRAFCNATLKIACRNERR